MGAPSVGDTVEYRVQMYDSSNPQKVTVADKFLRGKVTYSQRDKFELLFDDGTVLVVELASKCWRKVEG